MEKIISSGIISSYYDKLLKNLSVDVAIVGGGPSGLIAAYYLAKMNKKIAVFEKELSPGGGMWGGAMMFNQLAIEEKAIHILDELNIPYNKFGDNIYMVDSIASTSSIIFNTIKAGATIFNLFSVEDVVIKNNSVSGIVVNWSPVHKLNLHIDPIPIIAKAVLDSTGHNCAISEILSKKNGISLYTPDGNIQKEKSLSVEEGENSTIINTKKIFPGIYVSGMAANNVYGSYRMGPIFTSMLLSGKKIADIICSDLDES